MEFEYLGKMPIIDYQENFKFVYYILFTVNS